ncbi:MBL fold metallo-hydrolase [Streptomyces sp. ME01-18a]|uniref:MBL fold metallo-hydrolase n=1 Tax=Streptomyces sp. ME01-18a TaxID=3028669 RepID=UPI0029AB5AC0|nr:MBL fold metallo-hydrolase [Streptomyces sp. ME01-18a]MDX3434405.1 MBL fold metallo-hydrolase [Streptomyces sp. ME01-18a]
MSERMVELNMCDQYVICETCGVQYGTPMNNCPICEDERQYVGWSGQRWTTLAELKAAGYKGVLAEEGPGLIGIGSEPKTGIGQRALLARTPSGNVLWDMTTYLDDDLIAQVNDIGGVDIIAISHPHFYGSMVEWAHAFDAPIFIHAADRKWLPRLDDSIVLWRGDTTEVADGVTLINAGVHFAGGQVMHWQDGEHGQGALLTGDIFHVVQDRRHVSFMYSYPNFIPERPRRVRRALRLVENFPYQRVYGATWNRLIDTNGVEAVSRSAERYLDHALDGPDERL